jgi:hypothetical protein
MKLPLGPAVRDVIEAAHACRRPTLLRGRHGIGKTAIFEEVAESLDISIVPIDLSVIEPPDLCGLPYQTAQGTTRYAPPELLPHEGEGLLVLEELARVPRFVQAPCFSLLVSRQLNSYRLPPGWSVHASLNPPEDKLGYDGDALDPALTSRFLCLDVEADVGTWVAYARRQGVHPVVIKFVESFPDVFRNPAANPRAFTYCSDWIKTLERLERLETDLLIRGLAGWLPMDLAMALGHAYNGSLTAITPDQVFDEYPTWRPLLNSLIRTGKLDAVHATYQGVQRRLRSSRLSGEVLSDRDRRRNLRRFLSDLPGDLKRMASEWLVERGLDLTVPRRRLK